MAKQVIVVVDADALIAQTNLKDIHHPVAARISSRLLEMGASIIYPSTAIAEASTHMQRVLNNSVDALNIVRLLTNPVVQVAQVNKDILERAMTYFGVGGSKKNTMFDCIVAAVAETVQADAIFSFDRFYKTRGFKLASEL